MYNFKIILHFDTIIVCQEIPIASKFLLDLSLKYIQNLSLFTTFTAITLTIISSPRLFQMLLTSTSAPLSQAIHIRAAWVFLLKYKSEPLVLIKTFQWLLRVKKKKKSFQWLTVRPAFFKPFFLSDLLSFDLPHSPSAPVTMRNSELFLDMLSIFLPLHLLFPITNKTPLANTLPPNLLHNLLLYYLSWTLFPHPSSGLIKIHNGTNFYFIDISQEPSTVPPT